MSYKAIATLSPEGQVTLPAEIRKQLGMKAGDHIDLLLSDSNELTLVPVKRRSILESRNDLTPLTLGRPLTQADIDEAIAEEMIAQEDRIRDQYRS